jgi:hypothetical protein
LDGTFLVNDAFENVTVRFADDKVFLRLCNTFYEVGESDCAFSGRELVLLNKDKMEYHYKKATAINVLGNGKTTK